LGLNLEVGYLADMLENDEEGAQWFGEDMNKLNAFLASQNLQPHHEPRVCKIFSCEMYGYSGLHYLRRFAAHLDLRALKPSPGKPYAEMVDEEEHDPVLLEYFEQADEDYAAAADQRRMRPRRFDHLILHSDSGGFYIPQDFPHVLIAPDELDLHEMIGSSQRLLAECIELAGALELPLDIDPESDIVWDAANLQGEGDSNATGGTAVQGAPRPAWQRYGIESFICLRLHRAAEHSIETGAAIVFC
jgi:hypothetical protein